MRPAFRVAPLLISPLLALSACSGVDTNALHKLACQQAAASFDLQSVSQLDALRKALGVAPGVDPLSTCRSLGVDMTAKPGPADAARPGPEDATRPGSEDAARPGSGNGERGEPADTRRSGGEPEDR